MQTLLDQIDGLKKDISAIKKKIVDIKSTPAKKLKPKQAKKKEEKKTKGGVFGTLRKLVKKDSTPNAEETELTSQQADLINKIHDLYLTESYEQVQIVVDENAKVLFGKAKKGQSLPSPIELLDQHKESVLSKAIKQGNNKVILKLMDKGCPLDKADEDGETPLMVASRYGDVEIVTALLPKVNIHSKTLFTKKNSLHFAAENNHLEVALLLIEAGSKLDEVDGDGNTALMLATQKKVKDAIKGEMQKQGVEVVDEGETEEENEAAVTKEGRSYSQDEEMRPLFEEYKELVKEKKRLDMQLKDIQDRRKPKDNFTRLKNLDDDQKNKFLKLKDDSSVIQKFHHFVLQGNDMEALEEVEAILTAENEKKGAEGVVIDSQDRLGETALMKAARLGYDEMLSMLILYKADVDMKDLQGFSALMKAAEFGQKECIVKLLGEGADVNATATQGKMSALMLAAQRGHIEICELLIAEGADHSKLDSTGSSALDLVSSAEDKERLQKAMEEHPVTRAPVQI